MNAKLKRAPLRAVLLVEGRHGEYRILLICGHEKRAKRFTYRPIPCLACLDAAQKK